MTGMTGILARIGIDAEALLSHTGHDRNSLNTQRRLTETVCEYGVLEVLGAPDAEALFDAIEQLSPTWRERWIATLDALHGSNRVRVADGPHTVGEMARAHPLPQELWQTLDLLVLSEEAAARQGIPRQSGSSQRAGEPELSVADSVDLCDTIKAVRELRNHGNFPVGTPRNDIWARLLAPLAAISDEATIFDRFFLKNYLLASSHRNDRRVQHVGWLIRSLVRTLLPGSTIRILGEWPEVLSEDQVRTLAGERLAPLVGSGHVARIEVVLAAAWPKGENRRGTERSGYGAHNRHLRFSCGLSVMTHEGFDRFRTSKITGVDGFTWTLVSSPDRLKDLGRSEGTVTHHKVRVEVQIPARPETAASPTAGLMAGAGEGQ